MTEQGPCLGNWRKVSEILL